MTDLTNRRDALKKGALAAGVGAAAISTPSIRNLGTAPAFAQMATGGGVTCMNANDFQWNTSANIFGWNGQPCAGSNNSVYTVDPTGGTSVCAGAWGDASVNLTGDPTADTVTASINTGISPDCYIVSLTAFRTNGTQCDFIAGGVGVTTLTLDMSCINSANKRVVIEVDCDGGLGC